MKSDFRMPAYTNRSVWPAARVGTDRRLPSPSPRTKTPPTGARHPLVLPTPAGGSLGDRAPDLSKPVCSLDVQGAAPSLGEGPLTDDPLGAGGDLQIRVWRKQRLGVANVTVPVDTEAHDNLLRGHLVRLDLPAPCDLHPTSAHRSIRRPELLFSEIVGLTRPLRGRGSAITIGGRSSWVEPRSLPAAGAM